MADLRPWVDGLTIGGVLRETAARHGVREAIVFPKLGRRWTWRELESEVFAAARGLLALGIRPGEHVAIWATNVPEWVMLQYAAAKSARCSSTSTPPIARSSCATCSNKATARRCFSSISSKPRTITKCSRKSVRNLRQPRPVKAARPIFRGCGTSFRSKAKRRPARFRGAKCSRAASGSHAKSIASPRPSRPISRSTFSTLRHHRLSQGGDAEPSQSATQRVLRRRVPTHHRTRPPLHSGAVLSLFRLRAGHALRPSTARDDDSRRVFQPGDTLDAIDASARRRSTACRRCSSRSSHDPFRRRKHRRCAPASWRAGRARSR